MQQGIIAEKKKHPLLRNLVSKIEEIFFFLISAATEHLNEEDIDRILESPDYSGSTVLSNASFLSEKISGWILDRNIEVASVDDKWMTPKFYFESNSETMLKKGINPFVVGPMGKSEFEIRNFEDIDQTLLESFITGELKSEKTEAYYSFKDSQCNEKCQRSCKDKMLRFKLYTGKRNFENVKRGGEGIVCFGTWHSNPAAFKLLKLGKNSRTEFETVSKLSHPNILRVFHVFRYQETEKFHNTRILQNWTVIAMEKHEKDIGELTLTERIHLPDLLQDALGKV